MLTTFGRFVPTDTKKISFSHKLNVIIDLFIYLHTNVAYSVRDQSPPVSNQALVKRVEVVEVVRIGVWVKGKYYDM